MSVERYFSVETFMMCSSIAIEKLLSRIDMMGMRSRTAVSKSMPVKPIAASPQTLMQSLSGHGELGAHGEAEAVAELRGLAPADVGERLRSCCQNGESWSRGLPASWVMMVLATSTVCCRSHSTR